MRVAEHLVDSGTKCANYRERKRCEREAEGFLLTSDWKPGQWLSRSCRPCAEDLIAEWDEKAGDMGFRWMFTEGKTEYQPDTDVTVRRLYLEDVDKLFGRTPKKKPKRKRDTMGRKRRGSF